jgi:hypothetical protein
MWGSLIIDSLVIDEFRSLMADGKPITNQRSPLNNESTIKNQQVNNAPHPPNLKPRRPNNDSSRRQLADA